MDGLPLFTFYPYSLSLMHMHPINTITVLKYIIWYSTILIVVVDNCKSLVLQCLITKTDPCEQSRCVTGVAINLSQCPRNSPYRTSRKMFAIMKSLSSSCATSMALKYLGWEVLIVIVILRKYDEYYWTAL